jgi:hypothetical protein
MSTRIVSNSIAVGRGLMGFGTDTARKDSFQRLCTELVDSGPQLSGAGNYLPILLCFNLFTIAFVLAPRRRRGLVGLVGGSVGSGLPVRLMAVFGSMHLVHSAANSCCTLHQEGRCGLSILSRLRQP